MSTLTRRGVLKGIGGAGVAVVGWSSVNHSWVAADAAGTTGVVQVPPLDGTLETSPEALAEFSGDFGRLITGAPTAVLRPGSVQDIVKMVQYARANGLTIAMNGQSGTNGDLESHSNYGQALAPGGIQIDARGLATIHAIEAGVADVDAGVTWAELTDAAAPTGQTPPALTDFLHLSIGGTLCVGGTGGTMQKVGVQADNVRELQVVTGRGELLTCSKTQNRVLFNAMLAGVGQCGIIVRAKVDLVPIEANALIFNLFYDDLDTYIADQLLVMGDGRFDYQAGQIVRRPDNSGWRYMAEVGVYFTPPAVPDQAALLGGLSDNRAEAVTLELPYIQWAHRVDPVAEALKAAGFWAQPHPWVSLMVPASRTAEFIGQVVATLTPADMGVGLAIFSPFVPAKVTRPLMVVPRSEPAAFQLNLLRFPFPGHPDIPGIVAQNRAFFDAAVAVGGKRYVIGAIPNMTTDDWRRHYGLLWFLFKAAKQFYDPDGVLTPGQGIFT